MKFFPYIESNILRAPPGVSFTLASGLQSTYYLDLRKAMLTDGEALEAAADDMYSILPSEVELLGGVPTAGLPLMSALLMRSFQSGGLRRQGFYTRKDGKRHGTGLRVEGHYAKGQVACLVEDTVTTGGSILEHAQIARDAGIDVRYALCLFDREEGGREMLELAGIRLISCYTASFVL
jgi:orotate phosphoribosyltransferase